MELPINQIIQGDVLEKLKELPDECIDCIITSPPYYGLRDYGVEGQIGLEKTLDEYLDKMLAVTAELKRVLKKTGTMWWNHSGAYQDKGYDMQQYRLAIMMADDDSDDTYELKKDAPDWVIKELTKKGLL